MPSGWTLLWFGWGLYFLIVEGMALANSTSGDTLSEHVWAWLGITPDGGKAVTWRTWVRRAAVVGFLNVLAIHFLVGSNTGWNLVLVTSGVTLAALVVGGVVRQRIGGRNGNRTASDPGSPRP